MKTLIVMLALILSVPATTVLAHHKLGHHIPPGHLKKQLTPPLTTDRAEAVCFVQTAVPNDPYAEVVWTEWLPRPVAERRAETEGGFIIIHPTLQTEHDCRDFLWH